MSDTAEAQAPKQPRRVRKVPAIVLERSRGRAGRMLFGFLVGTGLGIAMAVLLTLRLGVGAAGEGLPGMGASGLPPYVLPFALIGLLVGLLWALLEGRSVTPRRDTVEIEVVSGRLSRRSSSTELMRR